MVAFVAGAAAAVLLGRNNSNTRRKDATVDTTADNAPIYVEVVTRSVESGEITSTRTIDHNNHGDRVWLGKHSFWAMRNKHSVYTRPVIQEK